MADDSQQANDDIRAQAAAAKEKQDKPDDKGDKPDDIGKPPETDTDIEQIAAEARNPDAVKNALTAERAAAKEAREKADELAKKVKQFEDRDKSEQEKLEERASTAEDRAKAAEDKLLQYQVAASKELPADLAERLRGKNRKELEEDADRLLELVKPKKPTGDVGQGAGEGGEGRTFNDEIRATALKS